MKQDFAKQVAADDRGGATALGQLWTETSMPLGVEVRPLSTDASQVGQPSTHEPMTYV